MIAVNPFLDRIPTELQEQYMTDLLTEFIKLPETDKTTDGIISFKYGLMVTFARKSWKLQASIGIHVQIRPISEARLVTIHPTTHANTAHKIMHTLLRGKQRLHADTKQCTKYREFSSVYIFVSNYYSHSSSNWNRGSWVVYGRHCMCRGLHFFYGKINYLLRTGFFIYHSTILTVQGVELVSDGMSHRVMRGCRWDLELTVHAPTANINCEWKDNFYEQLEQVFDYFPKYYMQILLGWCEAKYGMEDRFKPKIGKDHIVWIHQTLEKK